MVAVHQACQALRLGETSMGHRWRNSIIITSRSNNIDEHGRVSTISFLTMLCLRQSRLGICSWRGCRYRHLERPDDALIAGDPIHAVIRNSALNQDGKTAGISLPNLEAQAALMKLVYSSAGLDPKDTPYVECHGTVSASSLLIL
jgi:acyl transferase domain-containing protein